MDADGLDGDGPNDILMMDDMPGPSTRLELRPQQDVSLWDNGRTRLTWAVRELARRRTDVSTAASFIFLSLSSDH